MPAFNINQHLSARPGALNTTFPGLMPDTAALLLHTDMGTQRATHVHPLESHLLLDGWSMTYGGKLPYNDFFFLNQGKHTKSVKMVDNHQIHSVLLPNPLFKPSSKPYLKLSEF